ncbi:MAG: L-seryl-tRNA(Sec) selenium transferase, partial [Planctomycetota bacterium]
SQGGIILGKSKLIDAVRKNQFARIVRVGKLTLTTLEATLKLFLDESIALAEVPTLRMLRRDASEIAKQAEHLVSQLSNNISGAEITDISGFSQMGSGLRPEIISAESLAKQLRQYTTPIFARIRSDQVLIDPRTLLPGDDKILVRALTEILGRTA